MAAFIIFNSMIVVAEANVADCAPFNRDFARSENTVFELCQREISQPQIEILLSGTTHTEVAAPFNLKHNKSSLAESITVVLFIPALILLLFSRFTKSAK